MYCDYLENIDVPFFEQRTRSRAYIRDTIGYILKFRDYLDSKGYNSDKVTIYQIDKHLVGTYFEKLFKITKSIATYNHHVGTMKSFYKFLIEKKGYELLNPMCFAKLKNVSINTISVDDSDFDKILNCIDETIESDTIHTYKNGVTKKMYRPYIKNGIELIAYTGMRLTEALSIKYCDIVTDKKGEIDYVKGIDIKYEKTHNYDQSKPVKYVPIPITPELEDLLNRLNYKQYIGEDRYLIGPDELISRESMAKQLSHSFGFYRDKSGVNAKIGLKHLRKTFLTKIQIATGMVTSLGYQKTASVIEKNYLDKGKIAKSVKEKGFRLFEDKTKKIG
jgi:integrase